MFKKLNISMADIAEMTENNIAFHQMKFIGYLPSSPDVPFTQPEEPKKVERRRGCIAS